MVFETRSLDGKRGSGSKGRKRRQARKVSSAKSNGRGNGKVSPEKMSRLQQVASRVRSIARRVAPKVRRGAKKAAQAAFELGERVTRPEPRVRQMHGRPHIAAAGLPTKQEATAVAQAARTELGTNCRMSTVQGPNGKEWIIWVCDPEDSSRRARPPEPSSFFGGGGPEVHQSGPFAGEERVLSRRTVQSIPRNPSDGLFSDLFRGPSGQPRKRRRQKRESAPPDADGPDPDQFPDTFMGVPQDLFDDV